MERIAEFLKMLEQKGYLTEEQRQTLIKCQQSSEASLYQQLVEKKLVTPDDWEKLTAAFYGLPVVELRKQAIEPSALTYFCRSLCKNATKYFLFVWSGSAYG